MPVYQAICNKCGKYHEYIRPVLLYLDTPECCGEKTSKRLLTAPMMSPDIANWDAYESPATGRMINSKAQRREDMKASGTRDWEGMESEKREAARRKQYDDDALEAKLDHTVKSVWANLSPDKKAAMAA